MNELLVIFLNNLLPVFLIAGSGYLLARFLHVQARSISHLIFYVLSPCLIFNLLTENQIDQANVVRMLLLVFTLISLSGLFIWITGRALRFSRKTLSATMLAGMFMNAGNYGLPVVLFAFGEKALAYASLFFVLNAIFAYTIGVLVASLGTVSLTAALRNLLKLPTIYSLVLALLFIYTGWRIPLPLERAVGLLGNASLPVMLVLLGVQFTSVKWEGKLAPLALASGTRLALVPLLATYLASLIGLQGAAFQASVLESGMPTAVLTTVVATEYDAEPSFVTMTVFVTTLLSPLTLTPLLAYLGA